MKIKELIKATSAEVIGSIDYELDVKISTDTRTIEEGNFYLPLKGTSFDGEKFINQAIEKGAIGSFCTNSATNNGIFLLKVPDTLIAYLQLANYQRNNLNPIVVAITGSSGKTTTKELISSVLSEKYKTYKTPLNHNNEIGFCQTIFEAPNDTEALVLEMGMRGLGEIELLSKYAEPNIAVITNVGTAHIGRLGSRENIAKAKCEILTGVKAYNNILSPLFIAHNDELIQKTINFQGEKIYYSIDNVKIIEKNADYSRFTYQNDTYELNVGGDYNIENSLSAINIGKRLGLSIEQIQRGLKKYKPIEKRWEGVDVNINGENVSIINDSYNANPESMRVFIDTIFELYPNYAIVLGDMGELGENEIGYHKELGEYINNKNDINTNSQIISIGTLSKYTTDSIKKCKTYHFSTIEESIPYLKQNIHYPTKLFLKASRSMKFERIIDLLKN